MPTTISPRATSIGFGRRFGGLINKSEAPSPHKYNVTSIDFHDKTKGYQFGMSRDRFAKVYLKEHPPHDLTIPGPGAYHAKLSFVEKNNGIFTLRPKTNFQSIFNDHRKDNPGPGTYDSNRATESVNGHTVESRYRSPGGTVISKNGPRFDSSPLKRAMQEPGPGQYRHVEAVSNTGNYFIKKFKNSGAPVFSKSRRLVELDVSQTRKITPGPGSYRIQSEFGFYDASQTTDVQFFNQSQRISLHHRGESSIGMRNSMQNSLFIDKAEQDTNE
ncbi:UNKNOWN [Stylonychia lemnae]|uniref:Uncharacterized protein n=1 Tax=Stylonychia lemnae TaxID=5949 RepID=A0A077ZUQ2_STYLE|nr:UNKNOWN [Stylonychia lemnae]|eukprot:CDW73627.1 UNKNOWN [Stylonychia lemnae]